MRTSRLTARIDNNAIADGFQIYLHSFVVTREGESADVAIAHERAVSRSLGGRTVFDDMKPRGQWHRAGPSQLELFRSR